VLRIYAREGATILRVRDEDIRRFVGRDWAAVSDAKAVYWAARKATMSGDEALAVGVALHDLALSTRPGWPDEASRREDADSHRRVGEALRAVGRAVR
jgi:hypothetical protein